MKQTQNSKVQTIIYKKKKKELTVGSYMAQREKSGKK